MGADGSTQKNLTKNSANEARPDWGPPTSTPAPTPTPETAKIQFVEGTLSHNMENTRRLTLGFISTA